MVYWEFLVGISYLFLDYSYQEGSSCERASADVLIELSPADQDIISKIHKSASSKKRMCGSQKSGAAQSQRANDAEIVQKR